MIRLYGLILKSSKLFRVMLSDRPNEL